MADTLVMLGVRKLGREIALHFARQGWRVACAARTEEDVNRVAHEVTRAGGQGVPYVCDLEKPESLTGLGGLEPALCIASQTAGGRFGSRPLLEIEGGELAQNFNAYVQGTWNLLRAVGPGMIQRRVGAFLQIGTSSGIRTKEGFAVLGAAQHALRGLVQVAAKEWRAQCVHAAYLAVDGPIESERTQAWAAGRGGTALIPPGEIARACEYLYRQQPGAWTHELVLRPHTGEWSAPA